MHGSTVKDFHHFERWVQAQPDGQIQVMSGRWMQVSAGDGIQYHIQSGQVTCLHPRVQRLSKGDASFIAYEAYRRARQLSDFWEGINNLSCTLINDAKGGDQ